MEIGAATVAVAGGASGLGAATARHLAALGARLAILDRDVAAGRALAEELGGAAIFAEADVTDAAAVAAGLDAAVAAFGQLDAAAICAGIVHAERTLGRGGPHDLDAFARVVQVNLVGSFNVLRLAAARMQHNAADADGGRGAIVLTASVAAHEGQTGQAAYAASKGGVASLVLPAARDLARQGIRVNAVAPGVFATPMIESLGAEVQQSLAADVVFPPRLGRPEEFARMAAFVLEHPYLNGAVLRLDGALRLP